jgi:hypothetical protein
MKNDKQNEKLKLSKTQEVLYQKEFKRANQAYRQVSQENRS